jgi:RNA polymerase sigma-70 factor (ECF subfamily)
VFDKQGGEAMDLLESLYHDHRSAMYRRAFSVLGDHGLAEDAVQEAILRMAKYLRRFEPLSRDERRYLCLAVAKNMALNLLRKRGESLTLTEDIPAAAPDAALAMDLTGAIQALDEGLQQVVMLRLRYGFDTAETARLMGLTQGAVRRRLHRAREILRGTLSDTEIRRCEP